MSNWFKSTLKFIGARCTGVLVTAVFMSPSLVMGAIALSYASEDKETADEEVIMKYILDQSIVSLIFSTVLVPLTAVVPFVQLSENYKETNNPCQTVGCGVLYLLGAIATIVAEFAFSIKGFILYADGAANIDNMQEFLGESSLTYLSTSCIAVATGTLGIGAMIGDAIAEE